MQISPISQNIPNIKLNKISDNHHIQKSFTSQKQPILNDLFISNGNNELKNIKNEDGSRRFDNKELKEIKKLEKQDKIDKETVKYFADTSLSVKSISEVYQYGKMTQNKNNEYELIHNNVKEFDKPYENSVSILGKKEQTTIKSDQKNGKPVYEIRDAKNNKAALYSENNHEIWSMTSKENPDFTNKKESISSQNSNNTEKNEESSVLYETFKKWKWLINPNI